MRHFAALLDGGLIVVRRCFVPSPGVLEGFDLGRRTGAVLREEDVVVGAGVERWIEIDEVN